MGHDQVISERIIGCAINVHRALDAGLLESAYQTALIVELAHNGIQFERERVVPLVHRGIKVGDYRIARGLAIELQQGGDEGWDQTSPPWLTCVNALESEELLRFPGDPS